MALVGDVIQGARELIPDPAQVIQPPVLLTLTAGVGGGFVAGTYYLVMTFVTSWGETLPSNEVSITLGAGSSISVSWAAPLGIPNTAVKGVNIYVGPAAGGENTFSFFPGTTSPTVISFLQNSIGNPPTRSTAYNPDTDGNFVGVNAIYRWLNRALVELSRTCGGLRTYAGVGTQQGNPLYVLPANWNAITDIWYDGYWMQGGQRGNFFRRNSIQASILTSATISVMDNRTVIEVYPQPIRTAGATTLSAPMGLTDTTASVTNGGVLGLLPFGFLQIDSELVAYSSINTVAAGGLIRGLGGSIPATHIVGAPVQELNLAISGRQVFNQFYTPGQSLVTLPVPPGWDDILIDYVMYLARSAEQDEAAAKGYLDRFSKKTAEWARTNSNPVKRRQIGPSSLPEAYYGGVPGGGGWLIP